MEKIQIAKILQKKFRIPIIIENDAKAAAFAESKLCAENKKIETLVLLTLGTGIGSGIVFNGKLFHGATELGHMIIEENNSKCGCGKCGCFETIANASFLSQTAKALEKKQKTGLKKFDGLSLQKAASKGNKNAKLAYKKMAENLGIGLANVCNMLNPDKIVLAGGLANEKTIFPIARKRMVSLSIRKNKEKCKLEKTKIGLFAGAIGAALLAMEK
jgi:glucokinase